MRSLRAGMLRFGPAHQDAVILKATEDFTDFVLHQLDHRELHCEGMKHLCVLATANRNLPHSLAKSRVGKAWLLAVLDLVDVKHDKHPCTPEDLERAIGSLAQMPKEDASRLIQSVARVCAECAAGRQIKMFKADSKRLIAKICTEQVAENVAEHIAEQFAQRVRCQTAELEGRAYRAPPDEHNKAPAKTSA